MNFNVSILTSPLGLSEPYHQQEDDDMRIAYRTKLILTNHSFPIDAIQPPGNCILETVLFIIHPRIMSEVVFVMSG